MEHSPENMEHFSSDQLPDEKKTYTPRPKSQLILAWVLIAIVLFAFFGMCYWMVAYGRA